MRIIISPAKKMKIDTDSLDYHQLPRFIEDAEYLMQYLKGVSYQEAKSIWKCNDKIAKLNFERMQDMNLYEGLTPAILTYEGIQYQYMAPAVFETKSFQYIEEHLRILSGFYGLLRPFDGVKPYRLEMQAKPIGSEFKTLYEFWDDKLAKQLFSESDCIVNLASKEYAKCISQHLDKQIRFLTCVFGEWIDGKIIQKGTKVKMARGEMVRFMAEKQIEEVNEIKGFDGMNYSYIDALSDESTFVFLANKNLKPS